MIVSTPLRTIGCDPAASSRTGVSVVLDALVEADVDVILSYTSHDTFSRVIRILDASAFEQCFLGWIAGMVGVVEGVVALDGKTICGSRDGEKTALHMISAYATGSGLCLGQEGTRGKVNEIAGIKMLLSTLTLKGSIVTIDAIGRQTEIDQKTVDQEGDYLLAVKEYQSNSIQLPVELSIRNNFPQRGFK